MLLSISYLSSISRSRANITQPDADHLDERDEDEELDGSDSDGSFGGKSRMSFSYWFVLPSVSYLDLSITLTSNFNYPSRGGDTVEAMPPLDPRVTPGPNRRGASSSAGQSTKTIVPPLIRRSSAKEKFGGRLRSPEPPVDSRTKSRTGATSVAGGKRTVTPSNKP